MAAIEQIDQIHRYTVEEYEALAGHPAFDDKRVELIDGVIVDMSPRSPAHENVVAWLNLWLSRHLDDTRYELRVAGSLRLSESEPEPDIFVTDVDHPRDIHPTSAHLVIEVAATSLKRDTVVKPTIYAEAVSEYWVVKLEDRQVVVYRNPEPGGYRDITTYGADTEPAPPILGTEPMPFAELFAAA